MAKLPFVSQPGQSLTGGPGLACCQSTPEVSYGSEGSHANCAHTSLPQVGLALWRGIRECKVPPVEPSGAHGTILIYLLVSRGEQELRLATSTALYIKCPAFMHRHARKHNIAGVMYE